MMGTTTVEAPQKAGAKATTNGEQEARSTFATIDDARKATPASKAKLFRVDLGGKARFIWAFGHNDAVGRVARSDGYMVSSIGSRRLSPEQLAAAIEQMDPATRKALLARMGK